MSSQGSGRRKFLADAAKSLGLIGLTPTLSQFVVQTISSSAFADELIATDKIYLFFCFPGGPPRWYFDVPLTPNGNSSKYTDTFSHAGIGTYVGVDSGKSVASYKAWRDSVSGYWLPPVWGSNPDGGSFSHVLSNALFVRGLDAEINNHQLGRLRNQSPIIGGLSIAGVLAQKTTNPFAAITTGSISDAFKAEKPLSPVALNLTVNASSNPVKTIMSYFAGTAPPDDLLVKSVLEEFDRYAEKNQFSQSGLTEAKDRSDALVKQGVTAFYTMWDATYARYLQKVSDALSLNRANLFMDTSKALPVPAGSSTDPRTQYADSKFLNTNLSDLKNLIGSKTTVQNLAATFATIEILVTQKLTQVSTADIGSLINMSIDGGTGTTTLNNDQHFVGNLVSVIGTTFLYRAILACTNELIATLKTTGQFDKTVIHFGAEFSRQPKVTGSGSDHGFKGSSALVVSGMIDKTTVIGNTINDTSSTYKGTWGMAAPHPVASATGDDYAIRINDVSKTVCGLLGVRTVANNGVYLLKNNGDVWSKLAGVNGEAKNETA